MPKRIEGPDERAWMVEVGRRLLVLREIAGCTQEQMASMIGVKKQAWTKYEKGQLKPDPYKMEKVCARFKVSQDYIFHGTLFGVHPRLGQELAARLPVLVLNTKRILQDMGIDPSSGTGPIW